MVDPRRLRRAPAEELLAWQGRARLARLRALPTAGKATVVSTGGVLYDPSARRPRTHCSRFSHVEARRLHVRLARHRHHVHESGEARVIQSRGCRTGSSSAPARPVAGARVAAGSAAAARLPGVKTPSQNIRCFYVPAADHPREPALQHQALELHARLQGRASHRPRGSTGTASSSRRRARRGHLRGRDMPTAATRRGTSRSATAGPGGTRGHVHLARRGPHVHEPRPRAFPRARPGASCSSRRPDEPGADETVRVSDTRLSFRAHAADRLVQRT